MCFGLLFLFIAFQSLQNLQSSLFVDEGMGTIVLSICYSTFFLSAMFAPEPLIQALGMVNLLAVKPTDSWESNIELKRIIATKAAAEGSML